MVALLYSTRVFCNKIGAGTHYQTRSDIRRGKISFLGFSYKILLRNFKKSL